MGWWECLLVWGAVLLITLLIEINTADLTSIWFSAASLVSLILSVFKTKFYVQLIVFIVLGFILVLCTRPLTKKIMQHETIRTNADHVIQMVGIVTKKISVGDVGEIKVGNELWRAVSSDDTEINIDEKVIVNSLTGNKVLVSKIKNNNNLL